MVRIERERGDAIVREMDKLVDRMKEVADAIEERINSIEFADSDQL